ncbi:MAG: aminoacyl-tRNA hydrolase [Candidatus Omnitrophica bacterium]|nr:aminoacyl-tRNA hydrolase [Candidatus Omnitrophota bacterium]
MKLIVGLGNPGKNYENTRHNIGSAVVKALGKNHGVVLKRGLFGSSLSAKIKINGQLCLLAIPLSYMNLSGGAVKSLVTKHKVDLSDLIVVHDELDLEAGKIRIKTGGSSGGHNGLESIIGVLKNNEFCRLRLGIGRPEQKFADIAAYVLSVFKKSESTLVGKVIEKACQALELWVEAGTQQSMNTINR